MEQITRFALLIGSTKAFDSSIKPLPKQVRDVNLNVMEEVLTSLGDYSFAWADNDKPRILKDKSRSQILSVLEKIDDPPRDSLFLLYYFGHGFFGNNGNLCLSLPGVSATNSEQYTLQSLVQEIIGRGFKRVIIIVDSCHSGFAHQTISISNNIDYFLMPSTGTGYSHFDENGGKFTRALSDALSIKNRKKLRDPGKDGVTFSTWFDYARGEVEKSSQAPVSSGSLGDEILVESEIIPPAHRNFSAPLRSVYTKLYYILEVLYDGERTLDQIAEEIDRQELAAFKITVNHEGELIEGYVSRSKLLEYLNILAGVKFIVQNKDNSAWALSQSGKEAVQNSGQLYNEKLVTGIFDWLPGRLSKKVLIKILSDLATKCQLPNIRNIERVLVEKNISWFDRKKLRHSLRLLSYAGVIQRGSIDTYFPV